MGEKGVGVRMMCMDVSACDYDVCVRWGMGCVQRRGLERSVEVVSGCVGDKWAGRRY